MANRSKKTHSGASALNDVGNGAVDLQGAQGVTMYVKFGSGTTAGAVKLQGSPSGAGGEGVQASDADWVDIGAPVTWATANTTKYLYSAEGHRFVRAKVSTAIGGGTVDVTIVTVGFAGGNFAE
jgi:hypothetical protein